MSNKHFGFEPTPHAENSGVGSSFFLKIYLFTFGCAGSSLLHVDFL